jgi:hypothetical protein
MWWDGTEPPPNQASRSVRESGPCGVRRLESDIAAMAAAGEAASAEPTAVHRRGNQRRTISAFSSGYRRRALGIFGR